MIISNVSSKGCMTHSLKTDPDASPSRYGQTTEEKGRGGEEGEGGGGKGGGGGGRWEGGGGI